jgi:light-regulated signal transduction histidine kinase (bacteriophytochrome)
MSDREWQLFLDTAVHDLRAQLRTIATSCGLLSEMSGEGPNDDTIQLTQRLDEGIVRMTALLKALDEYSMALHIQDDSFGPVPTESVVRAALAEIAPMVRDTGASVEYTPLPSVTGNWEVLTLLFRNLLTNGLRYRGAEAPHLTISAEPDGEAWRFAIRDNGVGVDAHYHEQIFAPFKRLHGSDKSGSGLGLATCTKIVEQHGGRIWVESTVGNGAVFLFTLPGSANP